MKNVLLVLILCLPGLLASAARPSDGGAAATEDATDWAFGGHAKYQRPSFTCGVRPGCGIRIADHAGEHARQPARDQRLEQGCRVGIAARPRVVLGVREDHGATARGRDAPQFCHRLLDRVQLERELALALPQRVGEPARRHGDRGGIGAAGIDRRTAVRHVRRRKARRETDGQQRRALRGRNFAHQRLQRLRQRGLRRERHEEVELLEVPCDRWPVQQVVHDPRRTGAAVRHVHVRVGAVGHECRGLSCHLAHHEEQLGFALQLVRGCVSTARDVAAAMPWQRNWESFGGLDLCMAVAETHAHLARLELGGFVERVGSESTGRPLRIAGTFDVTLSLRPTLVAEEITLENAPWGSEREMVRIARIEGSVDLRSLWKPPIRIGRLTIEGVRVHLERDAEGRGNWEIRKTPPPVPAPARAARSPVVFDRASIRDLELTYRGRPDAPVVHFGIARLDAAHEPGTGMIAVDGAGAFQAAPWEIAGRLGTLDRLWELRDVEQAVTGRIGESRLSFRGRIRDPLALRGPDAEIDLEGPDLARALAIFGLGSPLEGPFRLGARLRPSDEAVAIDGNAGAGGVRAGVGGRVRNLLD